VECPICGLLFSKSVISAHADRCLDEADVDNDACTSDVSLSLDSKRLRVEQTTDVTFTPDLAQSSSPTFCTLTRPSLSTELSPIAVAISADCDSLRQESAQNVRSASSGSTSTSKSGNVKLTHANGTLKRSTKPAKLLDFFTGSKKSDQSNEIKSARGSVKPAAVNQSLSRLDVQRVKLTEESLQSMATGDISGTLLCDSSITKELESSVATVSHNLLPKPSIQSSSVPLAERMRPTMLADFVGQGHVVGSKRPLTSLLESTSIISMILWGPPGCGKV